MKRSLALFGIGAAASLLSFGVVVFAEEPTVEQKPPTEKKIQMGVTVPVVIYEITAASVVTAVDAKAKTLEIQIAKGVQVIDHTVNKAVDAPADKETKKTFAITDNTKFFKDGKEIALGDIAVGKFVRVSYVRAKDDDTKMNVRRITVLDKESEKKTTDRWTNEKAEWIQEWLKAEQEGK